jgi:hypothetical protein
MVANSLKINSLRRVILFLRLYDVSCDRCLQPYLPSQNIIDEANEPLIVITQHACEPFFPQASAFTATSAHPGLSSQRTSRAHLLYRILPPSFFAFEATQYSILHWSL